MHLHTSTSLMSSLSSLPSTMGNASLPQTGLETWKAWEQPLPAVEAKSKPKNTSNTSTQSIANERKPCKAATVKRRWFGVNIPRIQLLDLQVSELHFSSSPGLHIFHILVNQASNKTPDNVLHRTVLFMHKVPQTWVSPINPAYSC